MKRIRVVLNEHEYEGVIDQKRMITWTSRQLLGFATYLGDLRQAMPYAKIYVTEEAGEVQL